MINNNNLEKIILDKFYNQLQDYYKKLNRLDKIKKFENFKEINNLNENFLFFYIKAKKEMKDFKLNQEETDFLIKNSKIDLIHEKGHTLLDRGIYYNDTLDFNYEQFIYLIKNSNVKKLNKNNAKYHSMTLMIFFMYGKPYINDYLKKMIKQMDLNNDELSNLVNSYQEMGAFKSIQETLNPIIDKLLIERNLIKAGKGNLIKI